MRQVVEACEPCQLHSRAQSREPHRPALEYVSRPMQAIGIDFFERHGIKYLLLMDHFSGLPFVCADGLQHRHGPHSQAAQEVVCHFWHEPLHQM